MSQAFDARPHSGMAYAPSTHITDVLGVARKRHSRIMSAVEVGTVWLNVVDYCVGWRVATVDSRTRVGYADKQPAKLDRRR